MTHPAAAPHHWWYLIAVAVVFFGMIFLTAILAELVTGFGAFLIFMVGMLVSWLIGYGMTFFV